LKGPTPHQRAVLRKKALWHKLRETNRSVPDPEAFDFDAQGYHFDRLSDVEWLPIRKCLSQTLAGHLPDEACIRELIDDAAISSGFFFGAGGELYIPPKIDRQIAKQRRSFLFKLMEFEEQTLIFFGEPSDDWDPWDEFRPILSQLQVLKKRVEKDLEFYKSRALASATSNAAKPQLDTWRARLILIWRDKCGLPVKNTKALRAFLSLCLEPYVAQSEKPAKDFIAKWRAGKVPSPGVSLRDFRSDKSDE
jgi:hypothetical protein